MDGALPWVSRRGTPGHNVPRPATSPADIAGLVRDTDLVSFTTRHTSPELTTNHNNLFPGRLGVALQDPSGRTDRIIRFGANPHSLALSTGEHAVKCPEGGSSSPYSSVSPELHSNPRSSTSNASSPRSTCAAPLAGLRPVPGSAATAPVPEIPEPPGPAFANYMTDDIIGHGSAPVRKGPERSGPAFNDHMTEDRGCAPVPGSASRSACTFYHAAAPLLSSSSSSLSSRRGHISTFTYSEGTSSPNHLRRHHQASSSSPASCGYISTSLSSPRDLTSASTTTTMSATPSHSRSPSAVTMPTAGSDDSGLQASTSTSTSTAAPDPSRTNKGKGKEVYTTPPGPSKKTAATAPLPATMASGSSDETVIHRGKKGPASTSSSSGEFCEMFLPSGLFTPSPQKVTKGPALAGAFSAPIFAPFAGPVFPAAADSGGLAGASVDERYAPMHTGEQGRIDASMRPIEHEAASWTASEAFKILAETVPAQYQGNPGFGWVISEVVRLAEERAKAKYGLPDHQTAAIKQYNVPFAGNLPPFQGYLLWRGDGQYTRLVPADLLPPLKGIPATQTNKVGYWVCPPPNAATETGWVYQQSIELEQLRPTSHQGVNDEELQVSLLSFSYLHCAFQPRLPACQCVAASP
ncbi:hypothetical protein B0T14DRAFT_299431 [Immersiella caudata]|uniref:Uncharacterized protein n=1 Tax=Immersiella caudata TaxID=314043 RepID=A0AA39WF13_9PEZI|nr:hypothetical protein B0T14DRAFT_299431 [Immersiella caudata]